MVTNNKEYQRLYMQRYVKEKGGELYECSCSKHVKKFDKTRHNKTKYHIQNADKAHTKSDIETLKMEVEELKKKLSKSTE